MQIQKQSSVLYGLRVKVTHSPLAKSSMMDVRLVKVRMGIRANGSYRTRKGSKNS